ncbi:MAG: CapA family protein [Anaerolineaceae bacterium]|nr:CapA family protein [Anaerolineaceae bacterium]
MKITTTPSDKEDIILMENVEDPTIEQGENDVQLLNDVEISLWFEGYIPENIINHLEMADNVTIAKTLETANTYLLLSEDCIENVEWTYALVAAFPTWQDGVSFSELQSLWKDGRETEDGFSSILVGNAEYQLLKALWGESSNETVQIMEDEILLETSWDTKGSVAIIPFENLELRWKVLSVDGISPTDQDFDHEQYALNMDFCLTSSLDAEYVLGSVFLPEKNRDPEKFTSVVMTGVTALVRATANAMEINGFTYPGEKIYEWMIDADFTHISNEVAFAASCPYPNPYQTDMRFCSNPQYIELFTYLDIDIVELTGNHIQDWSRGDFLQTLEIYDENGIAYYAGGQDIYEAKIPLLIEHNGNKLAFIGCNAVGPTGAFATIGSSGNANCDDYQWLIDEVQRLANEGYLPIVTLQHNEFYSLMKTGPQIRDFNPIAKAGAVIVSGSQAHFPNPFGFEEGRFIHYGLGNLFFDQMDAYIAKGVQREFIDRHIFYDGRHISTTIYTAYLENFAQPRPMTASERRSFLEEAFLASGWK